MVMTLTELQNRIPELKCDIREYLDEHNIPYHVPFFGIATIADADAEKAIQLYYAQIEEDQENAKIAEQMRMIEEMRIAEEKRIKQRATAQMLVTSGFNFDGYRIVKYSGYISGDDAMSVDRGYAWADVSVRDKLMESLTQIRRNALRELKEAAYNLGCNAVIGVDFDYITLDPQTANITGGTTYQPYVFCVTANGNAVIIEKIED